MGSIRGGNWKCLFGFHEWTTDRESKQVVCERCDSKNLVKTSKKIEEHTEACIEYQRRNIDGDELEERLDEIWEEP